MFRHVEGIGLRDGETMEGKRMKPLVFALALSCILIMSLASGAQEAPKQITFGAGKDLDPVVSPDGNHLAFSSNRTGEFSIFMLTFGNEGVFQLTQSPKDDRYPSWSPDGKKIVFCSKRTGKGDLYEMKADGSSGYLQITDKADLEEYPSYAPSGRGLLYATGPKKLVQVRPKMTIVFAEQTGQANNAMPLSEGDEPRFSPDGKKVVFVSRRTKNNDIWLMNADGTQQMQITTAPEDDENPTFSPDGKRIVFASKRTGNFDIWVVDADGGNLRQITSDASDDQQPCWSAGGYIYYTRHTDVGQSNIFRIKAP